MYRPHVYDLSSASSHGGHGTRSRDWCHRTYNPLREHLSLRRVTDAHYEPAYGHL